MAPLLAHAGEEGLYVLVPIVLIVLLVQWRQARREQDNSDDDQAREPTDGDETA